MTSTVSTTDALYKAVRKVRFVDVPELCFLAIDGRGDPNGSEFADAIGMLYTASYSAHFLLKKRFGQVPKVMPLEGLWWVEDAAQQAIVTQAAAGQATMWDSDRTKWRWRAMIMQSAQFDADTLAESIEAAATEHPEATRPSVLHWCEGRSAQVLHVGPYDAEGPTIQLLHESIAEAGCRPRGRHHEIYLSDPRRCAPERLRTILRQPVESLTE